MKETTFVQASNLKNFSKVAFFYLLGILLFLFASKGPAKESFLCILLLATLAWGILYCLLLGWRSSFHDSILSTMFFLCFFPKLELQKGGTPVLLNTGLVQNQANISYFSLIQVFLFIAPVLALVSVHEYRNSKFSKSLKVLLASLFCLIVISTANLLTLPYRYDAPFMSSILVLTTYLCCFFLLLTSASWSEKLVENTLHIFIALIGVFLFEYVIGKLDLVPALFSKYSFNYRNAFSSSLLVDDLKAGVYLMACSTAALYLFKKKASIKYLGLFFISNFLMIETFNRAHWMPYAVALILLLLLTKNFKTCIGYIAILILGLLPLSEKLSTIAPASTEELRIRFIKGSGHYVYEKSSVNTESVRERLGAIYRGLDLVVLHPWIGNGLARAVSLMADPKTPTLVNLNHLDPTALNFYQEIKSGEHPTNPHNFYVMAFAEFGLIFFVVLISLLAFVIICLKKYRLLFSQKQQPEIFLLILPLALGGYFMFQATPLDAVILLFLFLVFFYSRGSVFQKVNDGYQG